MNNLIGMDIGRYHIVDQIGEGGMATVYKAFDTRLEREVALKIIRRSAFPPDQLEHILKRFEREARTLAKFSHPNIVKIYDFGDYEGSPYLVLEYLPGGSLKKLLALRKGRSMPWKEAVQILLPIADALEFAHARGMVHRDVKPSNILLLHSNQPMLSDFGIAKLLENEETAALTGSGVGVGTPEYMAPEQWTGKVSQQSDLYSLGVILYEMVTGRKPYEADTPAAILLKQATQPVPKARKFAPGLPGGLEETLLKAMAPKPEERFPDMASFSQALRKIEQDPKIKGSSPKKKNELPGTMEDERTIDRRSRVIVPAKSNSAKKPADTVKPAQIQKHSRKGLWISLVGLATVMLLAGAYYVFFIANQNPPLLFAPTRPVASATAAATDTPIAPTPTPEAPVILPTNTPHITETASLTPTKPVIKRNIITTENGRDLAKLNSFSSGAINKLLWSDDNTYLALAAIAGINLYDAGDFSEAGSLNPPVVDVYFSFDGTLVAFLYPTTLLQVQKVANKTILAEITLPPHNGLITTIVFSRDNQLIAVGMSTGTILIWQTADQSLVATLDAPNTYVRTMAFSPDASELVSGSGSNRSMDYSLRFWNVQDGKLEHTVEAHLAPVTYLFYYPEGSVLASGSNDGFIYLWKAKNDIRVLKQIKALAVNYLGGFESMTFSRDGSLLAYSIPYEKSHALLLAQASDGAIVKTITGLPRAILNMAFSVDNTALATGDDNMVTIWGVP